MIKLEIKNIIDENDAEMPRLELWLVSPRQMVVEASSVIEYITEEEFKSAWRKLSERKIELESKYNDVASNPSLPIDYKRALRQKVERLLKSIDEVTKEKPHARIIN